MEPSFPRHLISTWRPLRLKGLSLLKLPKRHPRRQVFQILHLQDHVPVETCQMLLERLEIVVPAGMKTLKIGQN